MPNLLKFLSTAPSQKIRTLAHFLEEHFEEILALYYFIYLFIFFFFFLTTCFLFWLCLSWSSSKSIRCCHFESFGLSQPNSAKNKSMYINWDQSMTLSLYFSIKYSHHIIKDAFVAPLIKKESEKQKTSVQ